MLRGCFALGGISALHTVDGNHEERMLRESNILELRHKGVFQI